MSPQIVARAARPQEAKALSALALRSKAAWGYDAAFLNCCRDELRVGAAEIAQGRVTVAEAGGRLVGFASWQPSPVPELVMLFVEPDAMRQGIGARLLAEARRQAAEAGCKELLVESDPHAVAFYVAHGAHEVGQRVSSATGRTLPLLSLPTA